MKITDNFGVTWNLSPTERCPTCGQPDSCGDCNHEPLREGEWRRLGGFVDRSGYGGDPATGVLCDQCCMFGQRDDPREFGVARGKGGPIALHHKLECLNHPSNDHLADPVWESSYDEFFVAVFQVAPEFGFGFVAELTTADRTGGISWEQQLPTIHAEPSGAMLEGLATAADYIRAEIELERRYWADMEAMP